MTAPLARIFAATCVLVLTTVAAPAQSRSGEVEALKAMTRRCVTLEAKPSPAEYEALAKLMRVPVAEVPRAFCSRILAGIQSGSLTAADIGAPVSGNYSATLTRALQTAAPNI